MPQLQVQTLNSESLKTQLKQVIEISIKIECMQ